MRTPLICQVSALPHHNVQHGKMRSHPRRSSHRSGFTLIEVAVALVIFVIGALAILRIFPPALGLIQGSESRAIAMRMDKSTLSNLANNPGQVPDAIFDVSSYNSSTFTWTWNDAVTSGGLPIAVVGTTSLNHSIPADIIASAFTNSSLSHFKHIMRETHTVLADSTGKLFVLTKFPYQGNVQVFTEDQVKDVVLSSTPANQDELDFSNAHLASTGALFSDAAPNSIRPPDNARTADGVTYYVSYQWNEDITGAGYKRVQSVTDEPISMVNDGSAQTPNSGHNVKPFQSTRAAQGVTLIDGSVSVRLRQRRGVITTSSATDISNGHVGYLPLNAVTFPTLHAGDTVTLDYDVEDWRQLLDDSVPNLAAPLPTPAYPAAIANSVAAVSMPIRNIDDTQPAWVSSLLMDTTNPQAIGLNQAEWNSNSSPASASGAGSNPHASALVDVNTKSGRVVYNINGIKAPHARTGYRTLDSWAHQLSVAARSYIPFYGTQYSTYLYSFDEQWREYELVKSNSQLVFHPSEAGKSIMVSYEYSDLGSPPKYTQVVGSIIAINEQPDPSPDANFGATVAAAQLTDQAGNILGANRITAITSVEGVDIRARTAYIDNNHYNQSAVVAYRSAGSL
ncbi:MAG: prepilin-type N-terminal cleavage/methylation domain-containing protein [Abitibacteriaceae bacterium]|nr:prepilin-type N-terminal cleavage/methylation domain-containing protein [Abditibacteriaceae bacterium]